MVVDLSPVLRAVEISTFWQGQLVDYRRADAEQWATGRHSDGALVHEVRPFAEPAMPLAAAQPDWHFLRILTVLGLVVAMLVVVFELTPKTEWLYVLEDQLGTMTLDLTPGGLGRLRAGRHHAQVIVKRPTQARTRRTGSLIPSPPGSRTYREPESAVLRSLLVDSISSKSVGILGVLSSTEDVFGGTIGGIEGGVIGLSRLDSSVTAVGSGGLGSRGSGVGGGGSGYGTIGMGRISRLESKKKTTTKIRSVRCGEVVRTIQRVAQRPVSAEESRQLRRMCLRRVSTEAMTCVVRVADDGGGARRMLDECSSLPPLYRDILGG